MNFYVNNGYVNKTNVHISIVHKLLGTLTIGTLFRPGLVWAGINADIWLLVVNLNISNFNPQRLWADE